MIAVREATRSDLKTAGGLLAAQLEEHAMPAEPQQIAQGLAAAFALEETATLLLAERAGRAVGVCLANRIASVELGGAVLFIEELFVEPAERRKGVARALFAHLLKEAKGRGVRAMELQVDMGHEPARALYRSLGFAARARTPLVLDLRKGG
jgi:GNAT superfamily N-acetyltransferase